MKIPWRRFWRWRLGVALAQVPIFWVILDRGTTKQLLIYLGWATVITWITSELPTPPGRD